MLPPALRDPFTSGIRRTVLAPFLQAQLKIEQLRTYTGDIDRLTAQRDSAIFESQFIRQLREENDRLNRLLRLAPRLRGRYVAVEVLHQPAPGGEMTLVLSGGRDQGITRLAPVVTEEGLVGIVSQVDRHTSIAVTWKHPEFRAGAMVAGGTFAGIMEPTRSGRQQAVLLELRGVPSSDTIPAGDEVFTSGGGLLPRGIPLGFIIGVSREEIGWERSYFVRPAVWPEAVSHALVLLDAEQADMSAGFPRTRPQDP